MSGLDPRERTGLMETAPVRFISRFPGWVIGGGTALLVGLFTIFVYAMALPDRWSVLPVALLLAAAAVAVGGLIGFLFGIPRTLTSETGAAGQVEGGRSGLAGVRANTNLEQISDWLTKILVGVTLVQLSTIRDGAGRLFDALAPALGNRESSAAFAGGVLIYFSLAAFLIGWLLTRLFLGKLMEEADRVEAARVALEQNRPDDAKELLSEVSTLSAEAARQHVFAAKGRGRLPVREPEFTGRSGGAFDDLDGDRTVDADAPETANPAEDGPGTDRGA